jgi:hypothetical protein
MLPNSVNGLLGIKAAAHQGSAALQSHLFKLCIHEKIRRSSDA